MKWLSPCTRIPSMAISCPEARIAHRTRDHDLAQNQVARDTEVEVTAHFFIIERADAGPARGKVYFAGWFLIFGASPTKQFRAGLKRIFSLDHYHKSTTKMEFWVGRLPWRI